MHNVVKAVAIRRWRLLVLFSISFWYFTFQFSLSHLLHRSVFQRILCVSRRAKIRHVAKNRHISIIMFEYTFVSTYSTNMPFPLSSYALADFFHTIVHYVHNLFVGIKRFLQVQLVQIYKCVRASHSNLPPVHRADLPA